MTKGIPYMVDYESIKHLFEYKNGQLYWTVHLPHTSKYPGDKAGYIKADGYEYITYQNRRYLSHRMIFLLEKGFIPEQIDHINMNRSDNRIENLREATYSQNSSNKPKLRTNTSGYKGVVQIKKRWRAGIIFNKKFITIGRFDTAEEAARAYDQKAKELFGEYARCNF